MPTHPPIPPGGIEIAPGVTVPPDALVLRFARGSGPGGQNVNKLNTKAELWITVSQIRGLTFGALVRLRTLAGSRLTAADEIHLSSDESRSQEGNKAEVLKRLRDLIIEARPEPKRRRKTKPTYGSKMRRLESKKRTSEIKSGRRVQD